MIYLYPYKRGSAGARELKRALVQSGIKTLIVGPNSRPSSRRKPLFVGWGSQTSPNWPNRRHLKDRWINHPTALGQTANKLSAFRIFAGKGVPTPEWTQDKAVVAKWLEKGDLVMARTLLNSHSGKGIVVIRPGNAIVNAPLYVRYKKKKHEYRIHVFGDKVLDRQHKRLRKDFPGEPNFTIRNFHTGWVYCRDNIILPHDAEAVAIQALKALGLTFGAVDVIWNEKENKTYVLEVNSAPGLAGTTVTSYATALRKEHNGV